MKLSSTTTTFTTVRIRADVQNFLTYSKKYLRGFKYCFEKELNAICARENFNQEYYTLTPDILYLMSNATSKQLMIDAAIKAARQIGIKIEYEEITNYKVKEAFIEVIKNNGEIQHYTLFEPIQDYVA